MEKGNRFLGECEGICRNGDENRRRTWTKWCVSERWNINIVDIKNLNEQKDAHSKTEQHGAFDSRCASSIIHKTLKGSVVALEGNARNCIIKSWAWLQKKVRLPNRVFFARNLDLISEKMQLINWRTWFFCSGPFTLFSFFKIRTCQINKISEAGLAPLHYYDEIRTVPYRFP